MSELPKNLQTELWDVAHALADAARPIALKYFRAMEQSLENKLADGFDPVTIADKAIEKEMRSILAVRRPDDGILGEEYENTTGKSGLTWVLDPIDGTRGFISGTPTWGVLIAVDAGEGPVLGLIDQPYTGERFAGGLGVAALDHNGQTRELAVKSCAYITDAIVFTTFPEVGTDVEGAAFKRVSEQAKLTRYGMDCYAYALLASGQIDLVIEAGLNPYDIQGPIAVVEAAGGIVTDWQGGPAYGGGQAIAASDKRIHEQALKLLNG